MNKMLSVWLCALLLAGCSRDGGGRAHPAVQAEVPLVRVCAVSPDVSFTEEVRVQGTVRPHENAAISARLPGTIDEILAEEGAAVAAGTPLFQTDRVNLGNAVRAAEDDLRLAQAKFGQAHAVADKARVDSDRMARLAKEGAVTADAAERAQVNSKSAEAALHAAQAQVTKAQTGLEIAQKNLADSTVKAPFAGVLTRQLKHQGDYVGPGTPVFLMDENTNYEVCFSLDASYYGRVTVGETCVDGTPVSYKSPSVNPATRTFEIRIPAAPSAKLAPGMLVDGRLRLRHFNAPAVPSMAVNLRDGQETLFVVVDGTVHAVRLASGFSSGGYRSLQPGEVPEGAQVVAEGMLLLNDGDRVRTTTEE